MIGYFLKQPPLVQMGGYFFILSINPMEYKSMSARENEIHFHAITLYIQIPRRVSM